MSNRILQLDFLKGILIINVIMIHLIYLGECHPDFKRFLLLFTTPSFFVISGYLAHVNKPTRLFSKKVFWWLVPYIIMEGAYIVMASLLPIKEHIDQLSLAVFLDHLFLSPLGPYWYIHDLIVCYVGYFSLHKALTAKRLWLIIPYIIIMIILALSVPKYTSLQSVLFFSAGIIIKHSTDNFVKFFHPSWIALPILAILYIFHDDVKMIDLIRNVIISYIAMGSLLFVYSYLPKKFIHIINMVGRNTLAILLFSPMFTIITKRFVPLFSFDPTTILFTVVSVTFCIVGCLAVTYLLDKCRCSSYLFGEKAVSQAVKPHPRERLTYVTQSFGDRLTICWRPPEDCLAVVNRSFDKCRKTCGPRCAGERAGRLMAKGRGVFG